MKHTAHTMGMTATVMIADSMASKKDIEDIFSYFVLIDEMFSTYRSTSEVSRFNNGSLTLENASEEVREVLALCENAHRQTHGYFDMHRDGKIDPLGMVKGYAIHKAAEMLKQKGYKNFFIEIAGDIEAAGKNEKGEHWRVGIENPFNRQEIIKVVHLQNCGIATSGMYIQGHHIYNPLTKKPVDDIMSVSVIAENVQKADMLATAAFAMGEKGILFLEDLRNVEGYMVKKDRKAVVTSGFDTYVLK